MLLGVGFTAEVDPEWRVPFYFKPADFWLAGQECVGQEATTHSLRGDSSLAGKHRLFQPTTMYMLRLRSSKNAAVCVKA